MNMPARTPGEPVADRLRLVRRVVVHDDMDVEIGRNVGLDMIQELPELRAAMAPVALSDDRPGGDIEGGEQRGRAIALVVMGAPLNLAWAQRQQGLGAIECLNLRFLVHTENHGMLRRVHIQPDDVARLVHKVRVRRQLEGLAPVWLQGKGPPHAVDRRRRIARRAGHRARAPLGRVTRRLFECLTDHLGHITVIDAPWTARARFVIEPLQTLFRKPVAPLPGGLIGHAQHTCDPHIGQPLGRQQHDVSPIRQAPPDLPSPRQAFQLAALGRSQLDLHRRTHDHVSRLAISTLTI